MKFKFQLILTVGVLLFSLTSCNEEEISPRPEPGPHVDTRSATGAVYTMSNSANGNELVVFERAVTGELDGPEYYDTEGDGTGGGLGSQGAVIVYRQFVLVCNAGSNQISIFNKNGNSISLTDIVDSEGEMPTSLAAYGNLVYVLNAGGDGSIAGFRLKGKGKLEFIDGSVQALSTNAAGGAQVSFNDDGSVLIVTEKATNMITTYVIDDEGVAGPGQSFPSAGQTPFGFSLAKDNRIVVSEASGGAAGASTVSCYQVHMDGSITLVSGPLAIGQSAACWVEITGNGNFAYTTNTGSANVTGLSVGSTGDLELLDEDGETGLTDMGPIDASSSRDSKYLYVLNGAGDSFTIFSVGSDGSLENIGAVDGLPSAAVGLAAE